MKIKSDGSTAAYYELPKNPKELQDLISFKNMNAQIGEIFRSCYRYGQVEHSEMLRDAKKILFYAQAEIKRLENIRSANDQSDSCEPTQHSSQHKEPNGAEAGTYGQDFTSQYQD